MGTARQRLRISILGCLGSLALLLVGVVQVLTVTEEPAAAQAVNSGALTVTDPSTGNPLLSGGSDTNFTLNPVGDDDACAGDNANDGYLIGGFVINTTADPAALVISTTGEIAPDTPVTAPRLPLLDATSPFQGLPEIDTGRLQPRPEVNMSVFPSSLVPEGTVTVGLACIQFGPYVLDEYWTVNFEITHDSSDPQGWIWEVSNTQPPTPTPAPTETPEPTATASPAETPTPSASVTPSPSPSPQATTTPSVTTTPAPTNTSAPTPTPTAQVAGQQATPTPSGTGTLPNTGPTSATPMLVVGGVLLVVFGRMAILSVRDIKVLPPL